ncbi:MAG TPA: hypothetical protein VHC20_03975 [Candidatus Paceibacterota bacterium]|nr:hypothetical protein [Candidatus Paceibacterota bacterium]
MSKAGDDDIQMLFRKAVKAGAVLGGIGIVVAVFFAIINRCSSYNNYKDDAFNGRVVRISQQKMLMVDIQTANGMLRIGDLSGRLMKVLVVGDSLIKRRGSIMCVVVRRDTSLTMPYIDRIQSCE